MTGAITFIFPPKMTFLYFTQYCCLTRNTIKYNIYATSKEYTEAAQTLELSIGGQNQWID